MHRCWRSILLIDAEVDRGLREGTGVAGVEVIPNDFDIERSGARPLRWRGPEGLDIDDTVAKLTGAVVQVTDHIVRDRHRADSLTLLGNLHSFTDFGTRIGRAGC